MKLNPILAASIGLNVILAGWVFFLAAPPAQVPVPDLKPTAERQRVVRTAQPTNRVERSPVPKSVPLASFDWRMVESEDYRKYMANLRAIGCPEKTIRDIIVADVNEVFDARRSAVLKTNYQYWKMEPLLANKDAKKELWDLYAQKRDVLKSLGVDAPDFADLVWQFYREGMDEKEMEIGFLPESQLQRVRQAMFEAAIEEVLSKKLGERPTKSDKEVMAELKEDFTPEELKEYELRASDDASMVRQQLDEAQVTEAEFRTIFDWTRNLKELLKDLPPNSAEYQRAALETNAAIANLLGPERFDRTLLGKEISGYKMLPVK